MTGVPEAEQPAAPAELTPPAEAERVLVLIAHLVYLLPIMGVFVAAALWQWFKERSRFGAFQAKQAAAFQLAMWLLLTVAALVLWVLAQVPIVGAVFWVFSKPTLGLVWLAGLGLAVWGGYQAYLGTQFRYPIVADYLEQ